jgi:hypothetical protein
VPTRSNAEGISPGNGTISAQKQKSLTPFQPTGYDDFGLSKAHCLTTSVRFLPNTSQEIVH